MSQQVKSINGGKVRKKFKMIPYDDLKRILEVEGSAFLANPENGAIKRQTIYNGAKRLSELLGKKVNYNAAIYEENGVQHNGYILEVEKPRR